MSESGVGIAGGAAASGGNGEERLDSRLERLEEIVGRLERPDLELEEALALFEEGVAHLRSARALIRQTELRVERLLEDAEEQDGPA